LHSNKKLHKLYQPFEIDRFFN